MTEEMLINNVDVSVYNARLLSFSVSGTTVTNNTSSVSAILKMPQLFSSSFGTRQLSLTLTFFPRHCGENSKMMSVADKLEIAAENISRFEALLVGKIVEISLPDGYIYSCLVQSLPAAAFDSSGEHDVTYTFLAIRHKAEIKLKLPSNRKIHCDSTTATPYKITVITKVDYESLTVAGITVINITAGKPLVIDGENYTVTLDGVNKFLDTDLSDFPLLIPGENLIECSVSEVDITIVYTPLYI